MARNIEIEASPSRENLGARKWRFGVSLHHAFPTIYAYLRAFNLPSPLPELPSLLLLTGSLFFSGTSSEKPPPPQSKIALHPNQYVLSFHSGLCSLGH